MHLHATPDNIIVSEHQLFFHYKPHGLRDTVAYGLVRFALWVADTFFRERYGHRAVVLETVAAVPGMVGGMMQHFKALRHLRDDGGWIRTLLAEAENERMHLMVFIHIAQPTSLERLLIFVAQWVFGLSYFCIYLFSPHTAHRLAGYLEEAAVHSYSEYLAEVEANERKNIPAPALAIRYWSLAPAARLREVIIATRNDEMHHRDVNHKLADTLN
ncbi:oxidase [Candidatus Kaiserbacteria bacterium RIFCSPHIGHO2_02_FULL_50_9]|uniref:Oxidase n=1 Tax=Candidatus Kaiserbacteria bacterium RIFCSPLOWO2_01_FULL_51_21 TaxID=1798508 RepID=A0A1F6EDB9_9BACT|nr:MAG: oxidase [Candidatus Kaiserbacteria bacterium RIFCSPHIGHO2_01_FULL_51_33]OGG63789.1 MAG: oxidase [Candidatus Kaiserbacteria bacterium RIFCSPHIGHO2_02_FULL_50_9]OGG71621.1 MAG: oxidase [Candidatus Kaiserbacteria bacterium RIFCSPLOWO2_01_FULL_51_21]